MRAKIRGHGQIRGYGAVLGMSRMVEVIKGERITKEIKRL